MSSNEYYSAALLVKLNAEANYHARQGITEYVPTPEQLMGEAHQDEVSQSPYVEMQGEWKQDGKILAYCIDEVILRPDKPAVCIEHKMLTRKLDRYYFGKSILQATLYASLMHYNTNKIYFTADFKVEKGYPRHKKLITKFEYWLRMGNQLVQVYVDKPVLDFYLMKWKAVDNLETAIKFDKEHCYFEFKSLQPKYNYGTFITY